jgi:branched-chain amino acid transport system substrate-binding protein
MRKTSFAIGILAAGILAALVTVGPALAQNIVIGLSTPATGVAATPSEWERWGVDLAVEEINAAGGVLGRKIEIMALDNRCNPSEAVNVANKLVEAKVVAIIGAHCSSAHLATMPIIKEAKIPLITGIASNPQITTLSGVGGNDWAFRINPSDQGMMDALGGYLGRNHVFKSVAIVAEDTDYGRGAADAFKKVAEKVGIGIISTDFHPQNQPDYTTILTRVQQRRPDAIATIQLAGDSINFLRNAMQLGLHIPYTGRVELGGRNVQIIEAGGMEGSINAWTYSSEIDTPQNKTFVAKILAQHKSTPLLQTWGSYDSMRIIAQAIREAGSVEPTAVRDAMKKLTFSTVFGKEIAFDDHNQAGKFVILQTVKNRKVTVADIVATE